jgi:hypothetical protein
VSYEDATLTSAFHYDLGAHGTPVAITGASNGTPPIQITAPAHGYGSGETVVISGVVGNTAANGTWQITVLDANNFTLTGSTGNGAYVSGGTVSIAARLRRGVFGSPIATHNIGSAFLRLDSAVFVWEADPTLVGTTIFFKFTSFNTYGLMEQSLAGATAYSFAFNGTFGNIGSSPANTANVDSVFLSGTADEIRIYGSSPTPPPGTSYTAWKSDQTQRTIPAQILTLDSSGNAIQISTNYWVSYDFNQATHVAWLNYNDFVQAIGRGQMRVGMVTTVNSSNLGGTTGGLGHNPGGGSGAPGRPLPQGL